MTVKKTKQKNITKQKKQKRNFGKLQEKKCETKVLNKTTNFG